MFKLTSQRVSEIAVDCLVAEEKVDDDTIVTRGVVTEFSFNPAKLQEHKEEIAGMLDELPAEFHKDGGGGMSFLNACMDKHGNQWGEHRVMEQLFCLGIATGKARYTMPCEMWEVLPGGMPYLTIN